MVRMLQSSNHPSIQISRSKLYTISGQERSSSDTLLADQVPASPVNHLEEFFLGDEFGLSLGSLRGFDGLSKESVFFWSEESLALLWFLLVEFIGESEDDAFDIAVVLHHLLMVAAALGGVLGLDELAHLLVDLELSLGLPVLFP